MLCWKREPVLTSAAANLLVQACSWGRGGSPSGDEETRRMICGLRAFENDTLGSFCRSLLFFVVVVFSSNMDAVYFSWGV